MAVYIIIMKPMFIQTEEDYLNPLLSAPVSVLYLPAY